jgi:DNA-binding LacI/PurR family transcriptional regulator
MPNQRADGQVWLRSWEAMEAAAREMLTTPPQTLSLLYKSDLHDSLDRYKLFMEDLAAHRLAGVIVSSMPVAHLSDWPSTGPNALPVVVYGSSAPEGCAFSCNRAGLSMRRAFEYLLPLGRRRVGLMAQPAFFSADWFEPALADCVAEFGMRCEPRWRQVVMPNTSRATGHLAELMMADPDGPDALLVMDDNAVEEVIAGVRTAGKRIPEDVVLVVAGNFPWPEKYSAPVKRFGVSMKQFIAEAARHIDARRRGAVTSSRILLDVFDETEFQRQIGT